MLPGPTIIKQCSHCSKPLAEETIASGNTLGATYWTDGKREAPMLPEQPWLVLCPHCHEALWLDELKEVGELDPWQGGDDEIDDAHPYEALSVDDYFDLLDQGVPTAEKEYYVRLRAWWAGNDPRRDASNDVPVSQREVSNLKTLAEMLDESDDNERIMKAEIMRELGCFEEAKSLLKRPIDSSLVEASTIIKRLVEENDQYVRRMEFG